MYSTTVPCSKVTMSLVDVTPQTEMAPN